MSEKEYLELKNALASTRMEDYAVTEQTERDCGSSLGRQGFRRKFCKRDFKPSGKGGLTRFQIAAIPALRC